MDLLLQVGWSILTILFYIVGKKVYKIYTKTTYKPKKLIIEDIDETEEDNTLESKDETEKIEEVTTVTTIKKIDTDTQQDESNKKIVYNEVFEYGSGKSKVTSNFVIKVDPNEFTNMINKIIDIVDERDELDSIEDEIRKINDDESELEKEMKALKNDS